MAVNIGPRIGIDGESEYRKQIGNIIQQAKTLASEMQAVTSAFGKNTTAQEKATATGKVLEKQIDVQRQRVQALTDMLDKAAKETGDTSNETLKWRQAVNEATAELNRMERELRESADATDDLGDEMEKAEKSTFSFGDALKANILSQAIVSGIRKLADGFKDIAKTAVGYNATIEKYTIALTTALGDEIEAEKTLAKIRQDAAKTPYSVDALVQANQLIISATGNAEESRQTILALTDAISATGGGNDELARMAQNLQQIANAGKATAVDIKQFAMAGIDIYGILSDYTGKTVEECQELEVTYELLTGALVAAAQEGGRYFGANEAQAQTLNGKISTLKDNITDGLGTAFLGVNETLKQLVDKALEFVDGVDWAGFGQDVSNFTNQVIENGPTIVSLIAGIGAGFATWNVSSMIMGVITAVKEFQAANEGATVAQALFNSVLKANPIVMVVSLIATLVAALITLYNTNEDFRNAVNRAWESVKNTISGVVSAIVVFFTQSIPNAANAALDFLQSLPGKALQWGKDMIQGFADGIMQKAYAVIDGVKGIAEKITSFLHFSRPDTGPLRDYESWMPDMMRGLASGIRKNAWRVQGALDDSTGGWSIPAPLVPAMGFAGGGAGGYGPAGSTTNLGGITLHIYGAEGQDVNELAEIVMDKIETKVQQIGGTWA